MGKSKEKKRGLQKKILLLCVGIVMATIVVFAAIDIAELWLLLRMADTTSDSTNEVVKKESEELVWNLLDSSVMETLDTTVRSTDGEFWTLEHDFSLLGNQVQDVFLHPDMYEEREIAPPVSGNSGKYVPQLMFAEWADRNDEESLRMIRKLANLTPLMEEIIRGNDKYTMDCFIVLPSGISIMYDDMSDDKINPDGSIKSYDPTTREWYQGAVATGESYFSSVVKSYFHDTTEIGLGVPVYADGELVAVLHGSTKLEIVQDIVSDINYGAAGFSILVSDEGQLIYSPMTSGDLAMEENLSRDIRQTSNPELKKLIEDALKLGTDYDMVTVDGKSYYACYAPIESLGWTQIMFVSVDEVADIPQSLLDKMDEVNAGVYKAFRTIFGSASIVILVVMGALIAGAILLASIFSKRLVTPVDIMTKRVRDMTGDNMNFEMESVYETGDEIEVLANSFSTLTDKLKDYIVEITTISAEKERIDIEIATASKIQVSMLPRRFPAFPERSEFDLYAEMTPAKEVGGDLYDFYFIDNDHLAVVIGDVSGKGISAALFMVMTKHIIQSQILRCDGDVLKTIESVNALLVEENDARMFVTVWLGVLTVSTGHMVYISAGHGRQIIYRNGGSFELLGDIPGAPVACRKKFKIRVNEIDLQTGDAIYLYTDGITEATDENLIMFGQERLLEVLNRNVDANMKELDEAVRRAVKDFVGNADQFDDMTTLGIRYLGSQKVTE